MEFLRKRIRTLLLGLTLAVAGLAVFGYCKKDDNNDSMLLLLGLTAALRADACAPTSSTGFMVIIPCGVAQ